MSLHYDKFILFGDSITQFSSAEPNGFQSGLQNLYMRKLDVLNRGFSGYNSDHAALILPRILEQELNVNKNNVKLITIFIGTNDAFQIEDDINNIQAVPVERYKQNLSKMTKLCLENNIKPIIIGPTLHDSKLSKSLLVEKGRPTNKDATTNSRNLQYSNTAKAVAEEFAVAFVDLWDAFRQYGGWSEEQLLKSNGTVDSQHYVHLDELLVDGIHFSPTAYSIFRDKVVESISKYYPELSADSIPEKLAYWHDINPKDLVGSIFK
ncbi:predicted protein [Scheffersomyces stipitis CBS 6054]|uniref:SGNH hydrolase-type esterase domain-containing protein n=1 Tax=Scheffersomyces stipitis (strain ATCC 58785 / CBS 6054 / NBRC 10063 / NRRL Y-11545) TaxID=322104 RepID=A3GIC1_PICST|nr:predicted protein [Scheffersomyces stipitis CBS 6054]EAZ62964.2 predicted protein [Scheffersomyces stipitis CBS 6054]KAG2735616.1 hypothetical protein G9P44_001830 [Scheffersomyces stipitis]